MPIYKYIRSLYVVSLTMHYLYFGEKKVAETTYPLKSNQRNPYTNIFSCQSNAIVRLHLSRKQKLLLSYSSLSAFTAIAEKFYGESCR